MPGTPVIGLGMARSTFGDPGLTSFSRLMARLSPRVLAGIPWGMGLDRRPVELGHAGRRRVGHHLRSAEILRSDVWRSSPSPFVGHRDPCAIGSMTPRLGGKAPAPGSGRRAEGPGIGAGPGDPAGGGPPMSRWPIPSAAGSERSGLWRAREECGRGLIYARISCRP